MIDKTKGFSFKTENKNVLTNKQNIIEDEVRVNSGVGRKAKKPEDTIVKKVLLSLTQEEYSKFKSEFDISGFPSESSFLKYLIKKNNII